MKKMINDTISERYMRAAQSKSDINEHLELLHNLAKGCETVVEFGVRGVVSTWALLAARPTQLVSYDITMTPQAKECLATCRALNAPWKFIQADVLKIEIPFCDMLFIDTFHTFAQLRCELAVHGHKTRLIVLHDTETFKTRDEKGVVTPGPVGLKAAVHEFCTHNKGWEVKEHYTHNNGLTVLRR